MAGEQKGKAYEAFTKVALERLKTKGRLKDNIFWDERPETMTIIPDLTLGRDKDEPKIVLLITHSGSAKNSDMKYWRNMGELAEAKILLPVAPRVFNLAFDSVIKENLKEEQAASFDGQLLVGDLAYGTKLQAWIDGNLARFPKDKHEKVTFLHDEAKTDKLLSSLLGSLQDDLKLLLAKKAPPELDQIWTMERKRPSGKAPRAKDTFVRRGLSKLMIFEDLDVAIRLFSGKRVGDHEVPAYAYELGLAGKAVGRATPVDEEIANAIATLGESPAKAILKKAPTSEISSWLLALRNLPFMRFEAKFVADEHDKLIIPSKLKEYLVRLHKNPEILTTSKNPPKHWSPKSVWLLESIIEILKNASGNAAGFGYAQLARAVADPSGPASAIDRKHAEYLLSPWGHLSEWIHRVPGKNLPEEVIFGVACILSDRLKALDPAFIESCISEILTGTSQNIIEAKLCTYRSFEPLRLLIEASAKGAALEKVRSCFGEKAELPGQATKTTVLRKGKTLINWQSVSDAGRDHKKKELCGRAVALRYSWDATTKKFIKRPGVEKLLLVVDGTWRREDLLALARAGWDEIFYPDEMDKLAKAIV